MKVGRRVTLTLDDIDYLKETFPEHISAIIPTARTWGRQVSVGAEYSVLRVMGIYPEYSEMEKIEIQNIGDDQQNNRNPFNLREAVINSAILYRQYN